VERPGDTAVQGRIGVAENDPDRLNNTPKIQSNNHDGLASKGFSANC
jgi:hypothetical protein